MNRKTIVEAIEAITGVYDQTAQITKLIALRDNALHLRVILGEPFDDEGDVPTWAASSDDTEVPFEVFDSKGVGTLCKSSADFREFIKRQKEKDPNG
jgi:hypothetical protein